MNTYRQNLFINEIYLPPILFQSYPWAAFSIITIKIIQHKYAPIKIPIPPELNH